MGSDAACGPAHGGRERESLLDGLRFVAAMAVVAFHFGFRGFTVDGLQDVSFPELVPIAKYGYLGVELFFMISGYVITWSIEGKSLADFAVARLVRLYPTFWLCAVLSATVISISDNDALLVSWQDGLLNATMLASAFDARYIDGAYWSLEVELQFYVLIAVSVGLFGFERLHRVLLVWMLVGVLCSALQKFAGFKVPFPTGNHYMYFCLGAGLFFFHRGRRELATYLLIGFGLGLSITHAIHGINWMISHYKVDFNRPLVGALIVVFAAVLAVSPSVSTSTRPALRRILFYVGGITYPLYLIHAYAGFSVMNRWFSSETRWLGLLTVSAASLVVAALVFIFFDRPVRAWLLSAWRGRARGIA